MNSSSSGRRVGESSNSNQGLAINAAFLKDVKEDNRDLKELLDRLTPLTSRAEIASNHWSELAVLMERICDQLAFHFSLEEAYGYFDEAIEAEPQLSVAAEALKGEHKTLFEAARRLAELPAVDDSNRLETISSWVTKLHLFRRSFEYHEEAELKLILEAMDDDLGVGD